MKAGDTITQYTIDEKIDAVLNLFGDQQIRRFYETCDKALNVDSVKSDLEHEVLKEEMVDRLGLISSTDDRAFQITAPGLRIIEAGGWIEYHRKIALEASRLTKKETRRHRLNVFLTIVSSLLILYGIYLTDKTNRLETKLEKAIEQRDSLSNELSARVRLLESKDKEIQRLQPHDTTTSAKKP